MKSFVIVETPIPNKSNDFFTKLIHLLLNVYLFTSFGTFRLETVVKINDIKFIITPRSGFLYLTMPDLWIQKETPQN